MTDTTDADRIRIGGLMRCCTGTLTQYAQDGTLSDMREYGVQCMYTDDLLHHMRYRDGAWEWDHD